MPKSRSSIGDIYEINTPEGLAYIQYTHSSEDMGQLVRVLPGIFSKRPDSFAYLAKQRELYFVFFTLNYAIRDEQVLFVAHEPVPVWAQTYPLMRWSGIRDSKGKPISWKLFSASASLTVAEHQSAPLIYNLTPEQKKLSIHQLWSFPVLVKEVARGWTPETAEALRLSDFAEAEKKRIQGDRQPDNSEELKHYLYFPHKKHAERAADALRDRGFRVEVRKGAGEEEWLVLAMMRQPPETGQDMSKLRDNMESLAAQFGGEYDGWEAAIDSLGRSVDFKKKLN